MSTPFHLSDTGRWKELQELATDASWGPERRAVGDLGTGAAIAGDAARTAGAEALPGSAAPDRIPTRDRDARPRSRRRTGPQQGGPRPRAGASPSKTAAERKLRGRHGTLRRGQGPSPGRRLRAAPPTAARWPPLPGPVAAAAAAPSPWSPPPTAGPCRWPACPPALRGPGPLHPSRQLTALRRIPLGGCAAILSELQSQDRPQPQSDWKAAGRV